MDTKHGQKSSSGNLMRIHGCLSVSSTLKLIEFTLNHLPRTLFYSALYYLCTRLSCYNRCPPLGFRQNALRQIKRYAILASCSRSLSGSYPRRARCRIYGNTVSKESAASRQQYVVPSHLLLSPPFALLLPLSRGLVFSSSFLVFLEQETNIYYYMKQV